MQLCLLVLGQCWHNQFQPIVSRWHCSATAVTRTSQNRPIMHSPSQSAGKKKKNQAYLISMTLKSEYFKFNQCQLLQDRKLKALSVPSPICEILFVLKFCCLLSQNRTITDRSSLRYVQMGQSQNRIAELYVVIYLNNEIH